MGPHSSYYWKPVNSSKAVLMLVRGDNGGVAAPLVVGESGGGVGGKSRSLSCATGLKKESNFNCFPL